MRADLHRLPRRDERADLLPAAECHASLEGCTTRSVRAICRPRARAMRHTTHQSRPNSSSPFSKRACSASVQRPDERVSSSSSSIAGNTRYPAEMGAQNRQPDRNEDAPGSQREATHGKATERSAEKVNLKKMISTPVTTAPTEAVMTARLSHLALLHVATCATNDEGSPPLLKPPPSNRGEAKK